ncbi:MAG: hypothetical protein ABJP34_03490 [Erythrobacter sp.]
MIARSIFKAALCATAVAFAAPALADEGSKNAAALSSFQVFQAKNQRLQDIGWKLAQGNAPYCSKLQPSIGVTLRDAASFSRPERIRQMYGLTGSFAIETVAKSSPAYKAQIRPNRELTAINGAQINSWALTQKRLEWRRLKRAHDTLDAALEGNAQVVLMFGDSDIRQLTGTSVCATRFEVKSGGKKALADGNRVQFGSKFPGFSYPEDEFAAVIAHELAHNVLEHRNWLDAKGRKRRAVRATEREADRLMPWLIANAGYDPQAAVRFMQRWGPAHSKGIFRARTHDGWDERVEIIAAEAELVSAQMTATGQADWPQFFRRDIAPLDEES